MNGSDRNEEIPNSNNQHPDNLQISSFKPGIGVLGYWSFSGIWMLEFGISYQEDCIDVSQISKL
jgi:hypothetical protein